MQNSFVLKGFFNFLNNDVLLSETYIS